MGANARQVRKRHGASGEEPFASEHGVVQSADPAGAFRSLREDLDPFPALPDEFEIVAERLLQVPAVRQEGAPRVVFERGPGGGHQFGAGAELVEDVRGQGQCREPRAGHPPAAPGLRTGFSSASAASD